MTKDTNLLQYDDASPINRIWSSESEHFGSLDELENGLNARYYAIGLRQGYAQLDQQLSAIGLIGNDAGGGPFTRMPDEIFCAEAIQSIAGILDLPEEFLLLKLLGAAEAEMLRGLERAILRLDE